MSESYLYFFNYSHLEAELFQGEFKALFNQDWHQDYLLTPIDVDIDQSVYIKDKITPLASESTVAGLIGSLQALELKFSSYKVVYQKNNETHVEYQETLLLCQQVAGAFGGKVKVRQPDVTIAITKLGSRYYAGFLDHAGESWKRFMNKPYTFSNALDLRMARTLINLAVGTRRDLKVVDPCCGMGSVVLEGLGLGVDIIGYDISRANSYRARLNLENYGYDGQLIQKSAIEDLDIFRDVAIIDLPYNLYTPITPEQQESIMINGLRIAAKLILVVHQDYDEFFAAQGFRIIEKMRVAKTDKGKFHRIIYVLTR